MVLVFFILILFIISIMFALTGTIKYKIEKLYISNCNKERKLEKKFTSYLEFYLFSKVKILKIKIDQDKLKNSKIKEKLKNINMEKFKQDKNIRKEGLKLIKKLNINLEKFKLKIDIGTENVLISSFIVAIASTIIPLFLSKYVKKYSKENYYFNLKPIYTGENIIKMEFNGIVSIKMVHIIYIIYVYLKKTNKKGECKKDERTSNRRSYGYSYE